MKLNFNLLLAGFLAMGLANCNSGGGGGQAPQQGQQVNPKACSAETMGLAKLYEKSANNQFVAGEYRLEKVEVAIGDGSQEMVVASTVKFDNNDKQVAAETILDCTTTETIESILPGNESYGISAPTYMLVDENDNATVSRPSASDLYFYVWQNTLDSIGTNDTSTKLTDQEWYELQIKLFILDDEVRSVKDGFIMKIVETDDFLGTTYTQYYHYKIIAAADQEDPVEEPTKPIEEPSKEHCLKYSGIDLGGIASDEIEFINNCETVIVYNSAVKFSVSGAAPKSLATNQFCPGTPKSFDIVGVFESDRDAPVDYLSKLNPQLEVRKGHFANEVHVKYNSENESSSAHIMGFNTVSDSSGTTTWLNGAISGTMTVVGQHACDLAQDLDDLENSQETVRKYLIDLYEMEFTTY